MSIIFGSSPTGPTPGTGIPDFYTLEAGSAADLQLLVNEQLAALAVSAPASRLLAVSPAAAGNGSRFAVALSVAIASQDSNFLTQAEVAQGAPTLASFAAQTTSQSAIVIVQGGTAAEATAALNAAIVAAKPAAPVSSIATAVFGPELVGSSNGAQWLAVAVLADLAAV